MVKEYPPTLECKVERFEDEPYGLRILGRIVNVRADEKIFDDKGDIDVSKVGAFVFDQVKLGYYGVGEKIGPAWHSGFKFIKK